MKNISAVFWFFICITGCMGQNNINTNLDIQGHRGCRGLMPENTIEGCIKAVDIGVNTLEIDVVVSKDSQLVVSHEPFFNHEISTHPDHIEITGSNELDFNLYRMTVGEIQKYDVGIKVHPRFPDQQKMSVVKPTLNALIANVEKYISTHHLKPVQYNIEIKHSPDKDHLFHPDALTFTTLVYQALLSNKIKEKCIIQSFDPQCLNILHKIDPDVKTALLVENIDGIKKNLSKLNYTPDIYSPHFLLVDKDLIQFCKSKSIKVIPWTVNQEKDITSVIQFGVDGIISDYPDRVIEIYRGLIKHKINH